jgi:uncharacterized protein (DUF2235 family)
MGTRISRIVFFLVFYLIGFGYPAMAKNLVICIDGTGNHPDQAEEQEEDTTNVYRFSKLLIEDEQQKVKYFQGVGTSGWKIWDQKGDLYGLGADGIRDKAYDFLGAHYQHEDRIYIFGFSRGAAIARDLTNLIKDRGIKGDWNVPIELLGLWDTVAAFGIPIDIIGLPTQSTNLGKKLDIPSNVKNTYHLLAIDEQRTPFIPTLVAAAPNVEEVWFAGVHADVGGGYEKRQLADISLRFMIERSKLQFLRFDRERVEAIPENSEGIGIIHDNMGRFPVSPRKIVVREEDKVSAEKPKIHKTVFARMENQEYAPVNVLELNGNYLIVD